MTHARVRRAVATVIVVGLSLHSRAGPPAAADSRRPTRPEVGAAFASAPSESVRLEWYESVFGNVESIRVADVAAPGRPQVVCNARPVTTASTDPYWYVADPGGNGLAPSWVGGPQLVVMAVANLDQDAALELLVADAVYGGTQMLVYDGATHALERTFDVGARVVAAAVADLDGDGTLEVVTTSSAGLQVFDATSGTREHWDASVGRASLALGNVDADPAIEIVLGSGLVIDGRTYAVEWTSPVLFGDLRVADLDGDGVAEVLSRYWEATSEIRIFDVRQRAWVATISSNVGISALAVLDVEGDGALEIAYGDDLGVVHVLNGITRAEKWTFTAPERTITDIAIGSLDADPSRELVFATANPYLGGHLYVLDVASRSVQWTSPDVIAPFQAVAYGDVDADGRRELLVGTGGTANGAAESVWAVFDASTHAEEYRSTPASSVYRGGTGILRMRSANVDADPQLEIFVSRVENFTRFLECVDGLTHARQWRAEVAAENLAIADLDGDGRVEVVVSNGNGVLVLDASTGTTKWQVTAAGPYIRDGSLLRVANVDADPQAEIVVGGSDAQVAIIDGLTRAMTVVGSGITALDVADRDGDGISEIVVGNTTGSIIVLGPDGTWTETVATGFVDISGLAVAELDGNPGVEYVVGSRWSVDILSPAAGERWRSGPVAEAPGASDSIVVGDFDGDGLAEVAVGVGLYGLRVYEVGSLESHVLTVTGQTVPESAPDLQFAVTLNPPNTRTVVVSYRTVEDTAQPGADFTVTTGTLTFPPGTTVQTVTVPLVDDAVWEPVESFLLRLDQATGATIAGDGVGSIVDDDPPGVTVTEATVHEPRGAQAHAYFTVTVAPAPTLPTVVEYWTEDGTAVAGLDFLPAFGTLTFPAGVSTRTVMVEILADEVAEGPEDFRVVARRTGVTERAVGAGHILDPGAAFFAVTPCRFIDTRDSRPLSAATPRDLVVTSSCGVPKNAAALAANVTVTGATAQGDLRIFPVGALPSSSTINYGRAQTRANAATLPLGAGGGISVLSGQATGSVQMILDVTGYFE